MMSPNGSSFIFIHRYYVKGVRYDRLMFYDFNQLKVLMNERIQSHYCWLDDTNILDMESMKVREASMQSMSKQEL